MRSVTTVNNTRAQSALDWSSNLRSYALAWGLPHIALVLGFLVPSTPRAVIWSTALAWMGVACIVNARRCGRTHCRYTGPFYLAMIAPVIVLGSGLVSAGLYGWLLVGAVIMVSGKLVWWLTEREWGKYS